MHEEEAKGGAMHILGRGAVSGYEGEKYPETYCMATTRI